MTQIKARRIRHKRKPPKNKAESKITNHPATRLAKFKAKRTNLMRLGAESKKRASYQKLLWHRI
ncbi:hypothetical protein BKN38_03105 [Helicobacter sp. CLO-3]|nr:hypothetical protein BA723_06490 [Helicobacter sp. CLO-3]OHU84453.1 hypothetical protein BKN38_03105 [Helicobacter sp. CLO-3]